MKSQRLRFHYRVTSAAGSLTNRELVAAWESAIRQAGFSLAYSEGRRPSPQIALAAPLPLGVTSDFELADVYLAQAADPAVVLRVLGAHLVSVAAVATHLDRHEGSSSDFVGGHQVRAARAIRVLQVAARK